MMQKGLTQSSRLTLVCLSRIVLGTDMARLTLGVRIASGKRRLQMLRQQPDESTRREQLKREFRRKAADRVGIATQYKVCNILIGGAGCWD
jgi:hypothetical protein